MTPTRPPLPVILWRYTRHGLETASVTAAVQVHSKVRRLRGRGVLSEFDEGRDLSKQWQWSACYAPLTSLYLDQFGQARACCQNTDHTLGDVRTHTLREIWDGDAAATLRAALPANDLSEGCDFCAWQRTEATPSARFSRAYDSRPAGWRRRPRWPEKLEFAVSNTCNLQCVMCNGDWSSAVRSQREHRAPLVDPYHERFYEELAAFIPHLREANFAGGEPFLARPSLRIMDLLVQHGAPGLVMCAITNGTVFNDRIERILNSVAPWISISFDGGTAEVYEQIRVGASFDDVLLNVDRFAAIAAERGTRVNLTHCLMTDNWSTFPELLLLAEQRSLDVAINTVRFPEAHSLYHLPPSALSEVIEAMDRRTTEVERTITGGRLTVWHEQLAALNSRAASPGWPEALGIPPDNSGVTAVPVSLSHRPAPDEKSSPT